MSRSARDRLTNPGLTLTQTHRLSLNEHLAIWILDAEGTRLTAPFGVSRVAAARGLVGCVRWAAFLGCVRVRGGRKVGEDTRNDLFRIVARERTVAVQKWLGEGWAESWRSLGTGGPLGAAACGCRRCW